MRPAVRNIILSAPAPIIPASVRPATMAWWDGAKRGSVWANFNQLLSNGNFAVDSNSDGLADNFGSTNATSLSIADGVQKFTPSAQYGQINYNVKPLIALNKLYYATAFVKASKNTVNLSLQRQGGAGTTIVAAHSGNGEWAALTSTLTLTSEPTTLTLRVRDDAASGFAEIEIKNVMLFCLSDNLGLGNEPTLAEMDAILASEPAYWDGTRTVLANPASKYYWQDYSGNNRHMKMNNFAYTLGSGWNGDALVTDGVDDYGICSTASLTAQGAGVTIGGVFGTITPNTYILSAIDSTGQYGIALFKAENGKYRCYICDTTGTTKYSELGSVSDERYCLVVGVYYPDTKKCVVHVNAIPGVASDALSTDIRATTAATLSKDNVASAYFANSAKAGFLINRALSGAEVAQIYRNNSKRWGLAHQVATGHYGVTWDKVNATMTRLYDAAGITTTTTNFGHFGSVNANYSNPFDGIYPWSGRTLCNVDISAYMALGPGADITDCIVAFLGDPEFSYSHENGVWVYTPEFWGKTWEVGTYRYFDVADREVPGYVYYRAKIGGRWFGATEARTIGGSSKTILLPKVGMPAKGVAMSALHGYAKNMGASIDNIYTVDGDTLLFVVEYATMNSQTALGNGVDTLYTQASDTIQENATNSATVKVLTAKAGNCIPGAIIDIGTADGGAQTGSYIIASVAVDGGDATKTIVTLTTDGTTPASVTVTTSHFWSVHGLSNRADTDIGAASGYIGTNSKCHAYYRGAVFHANMHRYVLGAYRQTGTGAIWIAPSEAAANAVDALNTDVHTNTGLILPDTSNYIKTLGMVSGLCCAPFCTAVGGSSAKPVGDYCYVTTLATANTVLILGGPAGNGAGDGRFSGAWAAAASNGNWPVGALPLL